MPKQPTISKDSVFFAAMLLMEAKMTTSSLEVKDHLRDLGFWAKQSEVSEFMKDLQSEHGWKTEINNSGPNTFTQYSIEVVAPLQVQNNSSNAPLTPLENEIVEIIKKSVPRVAHLSLFPETTLHDAGLDHLNLIQIGLSIDAKLKINSMNESWQNIKKISDIVRLVEGLNPTGWNKVANQPIPINNDEKNIFSRVEHILRGTLGLDEDVDIDMDSNIETLGADSLDFVEIIMLCEKEFNITIDDQKSGDLIKVSDMVSYIQSVLPKSVLHIVTGNNDSQNNKRKKPAVINDSLIPSSDVRVTINIDSKKSVIGARHALNTCEGDDWYVSISDKSLQKSDPLVYDKKYTSDNVRTVYSRIMGVPFKDVRARRIKNIKFK